MNTPNVNTDLAARAMGLPYLSTSAYAPWGLEPLDGPVDSAYVIYHLDGVDPIPLGSRPAPAPNRAHFDLFYTGAAMTQLREFLHGGRIRNTCPPSGCRNLLPRP